MKVLVAGWFSFEEMGATAGDILARDVVCGWLEGAGIAHEKATASPFEGGIAWEKTNSSDYSHVIFVCGPFGNGYPITSFLEHFSGSKLIGIDLTMLESLKEWNPFDLLLERESSEAARPDLAFLSDAPHVPVVGLVLVHPQQEYRDQARHDHVHRCIRTMLDRVEAAVVPIDTRLDRNATGLRSAAEIESLISRADLVITTRLHGMVLALKNGVPALAVDPISGGAKISRQAAVIEWPIVIQADSCSLESLESAFAYCRTDEARERAWAVSRRASISLESAGRELLSYLTDPP